MAAGHGACRVGPSTAAPSVLASSPCLPLPPCVLGLVNRGLEFEFHELRRGRSWRRREPSRKPPPRPRFWVEWTRIALLFLPVQSESKTVHRSTSSAQLRRASRAGHGGHRVLAGGGLCAVPFLSLFFLFFFNLVRSNLIQRPETLDTPSYDILLKSPPKFLYLHRSPRPEEFPGFNSFI